MNPDSPAAIAAQIKQLQRQLAAVQRGGVKFYNTKTGAIIFTPDPDGYYSRHQDWEPRPFDIKGRP